MELPSLNILSDEQKIKDEGKITNIYGNNYNYPNGVNNRIRLSLKKYTRIYNDHQKLDFLLKTLKTRLIPHFLILQVGTGPFMYLDSCYHLEMY